MTVSGYSCTGGSLEVRRAAEKMLVWIMSTDYRNFNVTPRVNNCRLTNMVFSGRLAKPSSGGITLHGKATLLKLNSKVFWLTADF